MISLDVFEYHILGGHLQLLPEILRAQLKASLVGGRVYAAMSNTSQGSRIVGVLACFGPGEELLGSSAQKEARQDLVNTMNKLEVVDPNVAAWWKDYYMPRYTEKSAMVFGGPEYKRRGWHISLIGVQPEFQSCGIGSQLIHFIINEVKKNDSSALTRHIVVQTASEKALPFYSSLGFVEKGRFTVKCEKRMNKTFMMRCLALELDCKDT